MQTKTATFLLLTPLMMQAANYSARKMTLGDVEVIRLADAARHTEVSIAPSIGNMAYEMKVNGKNLFWFPFRDPGEWKKNLLPCANPFLGPWAGRLDQDAYWANGKKYIVNPDLNNLRRDQFKLSIHGVLYFTPEWRAVEVKADAKSARAVSRLEFWKYPDMMAQFPFAHTLTMTYTLSNGQLEVEILVENHAVAPMPVSVGFHPFFRLHDSPRPQWKVHLAARQKLVLDEHLIPTGERKPNPYSDPQPLATTKLDDLFIDLIRDKDGKAVFWVEGIKERVTVIFGPKWRAGVAFTPPDKEAVCLEPNAAIGNAFNLAHAGLYQELQSIPPGGQWRESYWIVPSGF